MSEINQTTPEELFTNEEKNCPIDSSQSDAVGWDSVAMHLSNAIASLALSEDSPRPDLATSFAAQSAAHSLIAIASNLHATNSSSLFPSSPTQPVANFPDLADTSSSLQDPTAPFFSPPLPQAIANHSDPSRISAQAEFYSRYLGINALASEVGFTPPSDYATLSKTEEPYPGIYPWIRTESTEHLKIMVTSYEENPDFETEWLTDPSYTERVTELARRITDSQILDLLKQEPDPSTFIGETSPSTFLSTENLVALINEGVEIHGRYSVDIAQRELMTRDGKDVWQPEKLSTEYLQAWLTIPDKYYISGHGESIRSDIRAELNRRNTSEVNKALEEAKDYYRSYYGKDLNFVSDINLSEYRKIMVDDMEGDEVERIDKELTRREEESTT